MSRETLSDIRTLATRAALIGALLETFHTPAERKGFAMGLRECGAISDQATELLIEVYGLAGV